MWSGKKGSGKGKGSKGKTPAWASDGWASSWSAYNEPWNANRESPQESYAWGSWGSDGKGGKDDGKGKTKEYVPRLEGRYALAKAVLRPYADEHGKAVYASTSVKDLFGKDSMRQVLDSRNCELVRRPSVGLSTISGSARALSNCLDTYLEEGEGTPSAVLGRFAEFFQTAEAKAFIAACEVLVKERTSETSKAKLEDALQTWCMFYRTHKAVISKMLPEVLAFVSTVYLGGIQMLEAVTMCNALSNWAHKIPTTTSNAATLGSWQSSPKDLGLMKKFLMESLRQRHEDSAGWHRKGLQGGDSDDEEEAWGVKMSKRPAPSSSESSNSSEKARKKAKKEAKKHAKKERKTAEREKKEPEREGATGAELGREDASAVEEEK
ncbi:unnamed protein product [Symbiodinium natans]|uniref:Uncharacterized protein n=1 Tax=Symbiodinium natans TaxID=878477 RepID=A0A812M8C3_9DINO|nr:unnamed protein product [Symbiodinium natans]CAE7250259.1 unnamed protein product [Symbiodinium natans]CAE7250956.1 unnamed protein product [Symbiodinium natans]CAE7256652.1 unnamed protein product [Symbiodinium natans]CAE7257055.1 unnamed protein product [Symbiodinium natans]